MNDIDNLYSRPDVLEFLKISAGLAHNESNSWSYDESADTACQLEEAYLELPIEIQEGLLK